MQQTLLALLGMMTVTLMSFNQQRAVIATRRAMLNDQFEVMANGVALQAIEYIGTKAFDQGLVSMGVAASDPDRLSRVSGLDALLTATFPRGKRCALGIGSEGGSHDTCDDLSDFNEMVDERIAFSIGSGTVEFRVTARVRYVDAAHRPSATRTKRKEVDVIVVPESPDGGMPLMDASIVVSRTFSIP